MELRAQPLRALDATVTYQEPCHLVHAQRIAGAPRRLLARIPGLRLVEMDESAVCCGSAGIYNLTQPAMADAAAAPQDRGDTPHRRDDRGNRQSRAVRCRSRQACAKRAIDATVAHVVELLDDAYGPD